MNETPGIRPPITEPIRQAIRDAFAIVPEGKSSALLAIVDTNGARLHVAWKVNDHWKVGAQVGIPFGGKVEGSVAIEAVW